MIAKPDDDTTGECGDAAERVCVLACNPFELFIAFAIL